MSSLSSEIETLVSGEAETQLGGDDSDATGEQQSTLKVIKEGAKKTKMLIVLLSNLFIVFGVTLLVAIIVILNVSPAFSAGSSFAFFLLGVLSVASGIGMKCIYGSKKNPTIMNSSEEQRVKFTLRWMAETEVRRAIPGGFLVGVSASLLLCSISIILGETLNKSLYHDGFKGSIIEWMWRGISTLSGLAALSGLLTALLTSRKAAVAAFLLGFCSFIAHLILMCYVGYNADKVNSLYHEYGGSTDAMIWHYFGGSNKTVLHYPFLPAFLLKSMQYVPLTFATGFSLILCLTAIKSVFYMNLSIVGNDETEHDPLETQSNDGDKKSPVMSLCGAALIAASLIACVGSYFVVETRLDLETWREEYMFQYVWLEAPGAYLVVGLLALVTHHHAHRRTFLLLLIFPMLAMSAFTVYSTYKTFTAAGWAERYFVKTKCNQDTDRRFCMWASTEAEKHRRCYLPLDSECEAMVKNMVLVCIGKEKYCDGRVDMIGSAEKVTEYFSCHDDATASIFSSNRFADESHCTERWMPPFIVAFVGHGVAIIAALTIGLHTCEYLPGTLRVVWAAVRFTVTNFMPRLRRLRAIFCPLFPEKCE